MSHESHFALASFILSFSFIFFLCLSESVPVIVDLSISEATTMHLQQDNLFLCFSFNTFKCLFQRFVLFSLHFHHHKQHFRPHSFFFRFCSQFVGLPSNSAQVFHTLHRSHTLQVTRKKREKEKESEHLGASLFNAACHCVSGPNLWPIQLLSPSPSSSLSHHCSSSALLAFSGRTHLCVCVSCLSTSACLTAAAEMASHYSPLPVRGSFIVTSVLHSQSSTIGLIGVALIKRTFSCLPLLLLLTLFFFSVRFLLCRVVDLGPFSPPFSAYSCVDYASMHSLHIIIIIINTFFFLLFSCFVLYER